MNRAIMALVAALAVGGAGSAAQATTMDFSTVTSTGETCIENGSSPCYGDNVNSTSDAYGSYTQGNGFTPNVTTTYSGPIRTYQTGPGVGFLAPSGSGSVSFTLTGDPGFDVKLNSVDVGIYSGSTHAVIDVLSGATLLTTIDITASAATNVVLSGIIGHELTLTFSGGGFFGIEGLNFDQVAVAKTPIPAALPLLGTALGALGFARRRRNKAMERSA
ncbi:MAG TPA: VPLPA-CTERM sorting domain-containing protein [Candidatus Cybelea sp.]|nr:VPLPA-CTERM sorting domain-containing protein [Candidatus Cybelea sp.]